MKTSWFLKFSESALAFVACVNILMFLTDILPKAIGQSKFMEYVMPGGILLSILAALIFASVWNRKEKDDKINSYFRHAWFRGIIRYWLAFSISVYGFAKILRTQFGPSYHRMDTPVGLLNGFDLTWNYFAHSYTLAVILGSIQIAGSAMLLFRKTTLLGACILLPVLFNIVLINAFYDISIGAFGNSVMYSLGLTFLIALRWKELRPVFLNYSRELPYAGKGWWRWIARPVCVLGSGSVIGYFLVTQPVHTEFSGKWNVESLKRNNINVPLTNWEKDSTQYRTVYFEEENALYCCPNPYVFDKKRTLWLDYAYDADTKKLTVISFENKDKKPDSSAAVISGFDGKKMQLSFRLGNDTLKLQLKKSQLK